MISLHNIITKVGTVSLLPRLFILCTFVLFLTSFSSCRVGSDRERYELVGGDGKLDVIEFYAQDSCRFVAPGPVLLHRTYSQDSLGRIAINIYDGLYGYMIRISPDTLVGVEPFFDGIWVKQ